MTGWVVPVSIYFLLIQHTLYPIIHYDSTVGMPNCEVEFEQQASECSSFILCIGHVKVNSLPRADRFNILGFVQFQWVSKFHLGYLT